MRFCTAALTVIALYFALLRTRILMERKMLRGIKERAERLRDDVERDR